MPPEDILFTIVTTKLLISVSTIWESLPKILNSCLREVLGCLSPRKQIPIRV